MRHFCFAGSRPATTLLAVAPLRLTEPSINLHRETPVLPIAIPRPSSSPLPPLATEVVNAPCQQTATEIPIAFDAPHCFTSRGFLPWRFAYAGPGARPATFMGRHPKTFTKAEVLDRQEHAAALPRGFQRASADQPQRPCRRMPQPCLSRCTGRKSGIPNQP